MDEIRWATEAPDPWSTEDVDTLPEEDDPDGNNRSVLRDHEIEEKDGNLRIFRRDDRNAKKSLLFEASDQLAYVSLFPRTWDGDSAYEKIREIRVDITCMKEWDPTDPVGLSSFGRPEGVEYPYIKALPDGLGRVLEFGLTVPPSLRRIIRAIEKYSNASILHISKEFQTSNSGSVFVITCEEWLSLVSSFTATTNRARHVAARVNNHTADALVRERLHLIPKELSLGRLEIVKRMTPIIAGQTQLDEDLAASLIDSVSEEAFAAAKLSPKKFAKLNAQLDLVSLDVLIDVFAARLTEDLDEKDWQQFFADNRFALQQIFSSPLALVAREAVTRFPGISGQGAQFTDFLLANTITKTAHLVEIKTPKAKLFDKEYRGRGRATVYPPHRDLAGGIAQLQAQVASAKQTLVPALIQDGGNLDDLNTTVIYGAIIAGMLDKASVAQRESFLRFRWGLSNIAILTYDEVLQRLRDLRDFLHPAGA